VIQDVEDFCAELDIESLQNALDVVVLEHRKVHFRHTRTINNVASGVAAQVEARWKGLVFRAVLIIEGLSRRGRYGETVRLNVVGRITRVGERVASRPSQAIGKRPIVAALREGRIISRSPRGRDRYPVGCREDEPELPSA